jgi:predicted metal-dependent hydrolase
MSKDGKKTLSYTKEKYLNRTKRKKIIKKIERIKKEKINKLENELTKEDDRLRTPSPLQGFQSKIGSCFYKNNILLNKYINIYLIKFYLIFFYCHFST